MKKAARKLVAAARKELDAELARLEELAGTQEARLGELSRQALELSEQRSAVMDAADRTRLELQRVRKARQALDNLRPPSACRERCACGECGPGQSW